MIGFDCGTYNLVCCKRDKDGNFDFKREVNAFIEFPIVDPFVFNMMKKSGVPLIKRDDAKLAYALGEAAIRMAYTMPLAELKRPMRAGCVNPDERDAFQIMSIMMHSLLENVESDGDVLYYSVPSNAINVETDADYHGKILDAIFKAYKSETGYKVNARPINEALAIVYSELGDKNFTGIAVSFGSGMVNIAFAIFGVPVFTFALVNSGDWIDKQVAGATGENIAFVNTEKMKLDFNKAPSNGFERVLHMQYQLMIEKTVMGIKKGLEENSKMKARLDHPIDIVVAGGVASPNGFEKIFKDVLMSQQMPLEIGEVIKPIDPLFSVAKGCLIAAENSGI